jgi:membrane protein involved in colicin uptake
VKLQLVISKDGIVKSTKVIGGPPLLIDASIDAVKRWKFEEAKDETTQPVEFKYNN